MHAGRERARLLADVQLLPAQRVALGRHLRLHLAPALHQATDDLRRDQNGTSSAPVAMQALKSPSTDTAPATAGHWAVQRSWVLLISCASLPGHPLNLETARQGCMRPRSQYM